MKEPLATFDTVREIALALPGVEEGTTARRRSASGRLFLSALRAHMLAEDGEDPILVSVLHSHADILAHMTGRSSGFVAQVTEAGL